MKIRLLTLFLISLSAISTGSLQAQSTSIGVLVGAAESLEDGLDLDFGAGLFEVYLGTKLEPSTEFRLKFGNMNSDDGRDGEMQYLQALVTYEFDEVYGSTVLFAGPGYYQFDPDLQTAGEESDFGAVIGVGADFPMHRRLSLVVDVSYHWVNFDDPFRFLSIAGGARVRF